MRREAAAEVGEREIREIDDDEESSGVSFVSSFFVSFNLLHLHLLDRH